MNGDFDETGGTKEPVSTGIDKLYPDDCGRDKDKGTGLLCFPDGELCKNSKNDGEASKTSRSDMLPYSGNSRWGSPYVQFLVKT